LPVVLYKYRSATLSLTLRAKGDPEKDAKKSILIRGGRSRRRLEKLQNEYLGNL